MRNPTVTSYREDPLYPRIATAVEDILELGNVVAPLDVLVEMHLLTLEHLADWRRGQIPHLERAVNSNLTRLRRLLRVLRFHAHDLNLKPSVTAYLRVGRGTKHRLRFTKTGEPRLD